MSATAYSLTSEGVFPAQTKQERHMNNDIHELSIDELNAVTGGDKNPVPTKGSATFEVKDYSFDIEQTLSIGSQSTGAGAGKVTFNPF
jgi:bacteriocin-like protein